MEPAKIDWKKVESIFVEDKLYETINAPKWVDFLNPQVHDDSLDSEAWFCRPDCNHPKTAEDFVRTPTPNSKFSKSPLGSWNLRDAKLKWRWQNQSPSIPRDGSKINNDEENQNPNLSTLPNHQSKLVKAAIKSSTDKKRSVDDISLAKEPPRLKSTLSARNLFSGKDILSHISDFCNELKKMATRAKERENDEKETQVVEKRDAGLLKKGAVEVLAPGNVKEKERKPLLEVGREKSEGGCVKEKQRRKKLIDDAENIPVPSLNLENVKHKGEDRLLQIRTNPPSPQCFSATHSSAKSSTPSKSSKSRLMERGILQDLKQNKQVMMKEVDSEGKGKSLSTVDGREGRALDVFWFLTPCTLSG